jgi:hypothetical protein
MNDIWIRTCQSCGHKQEDKEPPQTQPAYDKWAEHKCNKCKSHDLDYGQWVDRDLLAQTKQD